MFLVCTSKNQPLSTPLIQIFAMPWVDLECLMLSGVSQTTLTLWITLEECVLNGKCVKIYENKKLNKYTYLIHANRSRIVLR